MPKTQREVEYIVQKILDKREKNGITEYLALWKGYHRSQATWEPAQYFLHAKKKVKTFEKVSKRKQKKIQKRRVNEELMRLQNTHYQAERIQLYQQLKELISRDSWKHDAIPQVLPKDASSEPGPMTFEKFLDRAPDEVVKVERYEPIEGIWVEKLETCKQIIHKNAARQLYRNNAHQDLINICGFSILQGSYIVRFLKNEKYYQCELDQLQYICPNEIIDYLLSCYDPSEHKILSDSEEEEVESLEESQEIDN